MLFSGRLPIAFHGPYVDNLSPGCFASPSGRDFSARPVTRLFRELALCGGERRFTLSDQAFWNRPRCKILVTPEKTAGMTEQYFNAVVVMPIEEKTCTLFAGFGPFHCRTLSRTTRALPPAQMAQKLCERHRIEYPVTRHAALAGQFYSPVHVVS